MKSPGEKAPGLLCFALLRITPSILGARSERAESRSPVSRRSNHPLTRVVSVGRVAEGSGLISPSGTATPIRADSSRSTILHLANADYYESLFLTVNPHFFTAMKPFIIDLETAGRVDASEYLPPIEAPSNYKDAEKIRAYLEERHARQLEAAALSAETARILCVGILRNGMEAQFIHDDDEAKLLRKTWLELETKEADEIFVGFNSTKFDFPLLARRSYVLGVPVPTWFPADGRWPHRTHCDLFTLWQCGDRTETISLDRLARLCGLPGKTGNGADFGKLWQTDRPAALDYLRRDLQLTDALWRRMTDPHAFAK